MLHFNSPIQELTAKAAELSAFANNINEEKIREVLADLHDGKYGEKDTQNVRLISEFLQMANKMANQIKQQALEGEIKHYLLPAFVKKMAGLIELQTKYNYLYNEIAFGSEKMKKLFMAVNQDLMPNTENQENEGKSVLHAFKRNKRTADVTTIENTFAKFVQFAVHMKNLLGEIAKNAQGVQKEAYQDYFQAIEEMMALSNALLGEFQDADMKPYQLKGDAAIQTHNDFASKENRLKNDFDRLVKEFHRKHPLQQGHALERQSAYKLKRPS